MSGTGSAALQENSPRGDIASAQGPMRASAGRSLLFSFSSVTASFLGIFLLVVLSLHLYFGSVRVGVRYLRGERLIVEPARIYVGSLKVSSSLVVHTSVHNHTGVPVHLLGASTHCTCVMAIDLPVVIQPGAKFSLAFKVRALPGKEELHEQVVIFTSDPRSPEVSIVVGGSIRE